MLRPRRRRKRESEAEDDDGREREREREREKFFQFVGLDYFSFDQFFCLSLCEFTDFYSLATFLS